MYHLFIYHYQHYHHYHCYHHHNHHNCHHDNQYKVSIHLVIPLLNETREIVIAFNMIDIYHYQHY
jgi:hypothetical protein